METCFQVQSATFIIQHLLLWSECLLLSCANIDLFQQLNYQSTYRPHHSTETAIICIVNHCALVLLDLSAAFDTIDHQHLLNVMRDRFGVQGPVHDWFASYISGRSQTVTVNSQCSLPASLVCGVPQGSVLGPVEFIIYSEDLESVTDNIPPILPHFYADDTQLLMSSSPEGVSAVCRVLEHCVHDVQTWCSCRRLQLNPTKTELIWFGSPKTKLEDIHSLYKAAVISNVIYTNRIKEELSSLMPRKEELSSLMPSSKWWPSTLKQVIQRSITSLVAWPIDCVHRTFLLQVDSFLVDIG